MFHVKHFWCLTRQDVCIYGRGNREKMEKTEKLTEEILYIQEEFDKIGVKLTNRQASQFKMYADLLVEWNSFMNLTAITDFKEIVQKHFIDSAAYVFSSGCFT